MSEIDAAWDRHCRVVERVLSLDECATSSAVAQLLADAEAVGLRRSARHCPLAVYLGGIYGEVSVTGAGAYWVSPAGTLHRWDLPPTAQEFVRRFDVGEYPALRQP